MQLEERLITDNQLKEMSDAAWEVRRHAYIYGRTQVGATVMTTDGSLFVGCNVEHRFRSHDIHAEVNAISSMVAAGHIDLIAVVVVAKRKKFTPCGACMDWIYQFGGPSCVIGFQPSRDFEIERFTALDLMPHYPT
jgi:cytidine deaminase